MLSGIIITMNMLAYRIKPGQDLKRELERVVKENNIQSGFVATCVGSLSSVTIRMAGAKPELQDVRHFENHYEIVSLVGTLSLEGAHLHIAVSDSQGIVTGGHLKDGSLVATTAEVVISYEQNIRFKRKPDSKTGFNELSVS